VSQIQALDRTQPGLPLKPGKCGTMTHDYKRNGATTLFAALNILDGTVIGRCMRRHRHQEFIRFLNGVERAVPAGKIIHAIVDNYAAHKQPKVLKWIADHPRWTFHFTPTSASWLNPVEGFFSAISRRRIRRGAFTSVGDLQNAIDRYIDPQQRLSAVRMDNVRQSHLRKTRSDPCIFCLSQCTSIAASALKRRRDGAPAPPSPARAQ
jgi:DDE superfamily endonuclease